MADYHDQLEVRRLAFGRFSAASGEQWSISQIEVYCCPAGMTERVALPKGTRGYYRWGTSAECITMGLRISFDLRGALHLLRSSVFSSATLILFRSLGHMQKKRNEIGVFLQRKTRRDCLVQGLNPSIYALRLGVCVVCLCCQDSYLGLDLL